MKQPVFSGYFWRKWGSFGGERSRIWMRVKGENYWEEKKLGDTLPTDKQWKKNIESFLEGIFVWSPGSLDFWVPLAKNIDTHVSLYILHIIIYIYIHMPSWLVFSSQLPIFSWWSRRFFFKIMSENQPQCLVDGSCWWFFPCFTAMCSKCRWSVWPRVPMFFS